MDVRLWKKKHAQARVRREYRTADEVLADAAERPQAAPKQTIIDMRGPQVQIHTYQPLLDCYGVHPEHSGLSYPEMERMHEPCWTLPNEHGRVIPEK